MLNIDIVEPKTILASCAGGKTQQFLHGTQVPCVGVSADHSGESGQWVKIAYYTQHPLQPSPLFEGVIYLWGRVTTDFMLEFVWSKEEPSGSQNYSRVLAKYTSSGLQQLGHGTQKKPLQLASLEENEAFFYNSSNEVVIRHNTYNAGYIIPQSSAFVEVETTFYKEINGVEVPTEDDPQSFYTHVMTYGNIYSYWYCVCFGKLYLLTLPHLDENSGSGTIVSANKKEDEDGNVTFEAVRNSVSFPYTAHDFISEGFSYTLTYSFDITSQCSHPEIYALCGSGDMLTERGLNASAVTDLISRAPEFSIPIARRTSSGLQQLEHGTLGSTMSAYGYKGVLVRGSTSGVNSDDYSLELANTQTSIGKTVRLDTNIGYLDQYDDYAQLCWFGLTPTVATACCSLRLSLTAYFDEPSTASARPFVKINRKDITVENVDAGGSYTDDEIEGMEKSEFEDLEEPEEDEDRIYYDYALQSSVYELFTVTNPSENDTLKNQLLDLNIQTLDAYEEYAEANVYALTVKNCDLTHTEEVTYYLTVKTEGGHVFEWSEAIPEVNCSNRSLTITSTGDTSLYKTYELDANVTTGVGGETATVEQELALAYTEQDFTESFSVSASQWNNTNELESTTTDVLTTTVSTSYETITLTVANYETKWVEVWYETYQDAETGEENVRQCTKTSSRIYRTNEEAQTRKTNALISPICTEAVVTALPNTTYRALIYTITVEVDTEQIDYIMHKDAAPTVDNRLQVNNNSPGDFSITATVQA